MEELARHFASLAADPDTGRSAAEPAADPQPLPRADRGGGEGGLRPRADADAPDPERGRVLAHHGDPVRKIPPCIDCHGPGETPGNPRYPILAGQDGDYLLLQLRLFREERRGGSSYAPIMREVASRLEEQDMRDLAAWYAALPWDGG